jgi:hypothetical protein
VDLRKGLQGNCTAIAADLRPLWKDVMTEAQVEKSVSRLSGLMSFARAQAGDGPRSLRAALQVRVKDSERVRAARARLVDAGCAENLVQELPPVQVILLDEKLAYEVRRDERLKLLGLAPWQIDALGAGEELGSDGDGLFADLLPDVIKVRTVQGRFEQRIALLRHVEALRLYAAAHGGQLPGQLSEVAVPLPADPFTGRPFGYQVEAATAHFRGSLPRDDEKNTGHNVRYQVTLQK